MAMVLAALLAGAGVTAAEAGAAPYCTSDGRSHQCVFPFIPFVESEPYPLQKFETPAGVSRLNLKLRGGAGGSSRGAVGGQGVLLSPSFGTKPGDRYEIEVGGGGTAASPGFPDGGAPGRGNSPATHGGAGGGSSTLVKLSGGDDDVRIPLVVSPGGGGAGGTPLLSIPGSGGGRAGRLSAQGNGRDGAATGSLKRPEGGKHGTLGTDGQPVAGVGGNGFSCSGNLVADLSGEDGKIVTPDTTASSLTGGSGASGPAGGGGGGGGYMSGAGGAAGVNALAGCPDPGGSSGGGGGAGGIDGIAVLDLIDIGGREAGPQPLDYLRPAHGTVVVAYDVAEGTPDQTPPGTTLLSKPRDKANSAQAAFTFEGFDDADLDHFECSLDGGDYGHCTSPAVYSGLGEGDHAFAVRAVDGSGKADPNPETASWSIDTTRPTVTLEQVSDQADPISGGNEFRFDVVVSEDGRCRCDRFRDGPPLAVENADTGESVVAYVSDTFAGPSETDPRRYRLGVWFLDGSGFSGIPEGRIRFRLDEGFVTDDFGNESLPSTSVDNIVTVDKSPPETSITDGPGDFAGSGATFAFSGSDELTSVASYECRFDDEAFGACAAPHTRDGLEEGPHRFEVRAIDVLGHIDQSPAARTFTVDTTAPETTLTSTLTDGRSAEFGFTGSDTEGGSGVAGFECSLDGGGFEACTSPTSYADLGDDGHTFAVRAVDDAGNRDETPAMFTWSVVPSIGDVIDRVRALELAAGMERALLSKLTSAQRALERDNVNAACGTLGAFLDLVNDQSGKAIDREDAEALVADGEGIRLVLGCK
jgi:hypothetical protein